MSSLMSNVPIYILALIVTLGVLIAFHEYGHFWVARKLGVKVLRFSIGFGKPLWFRKSPVDGTEYAITAIPLGGYVRMLDEREGDVPAADLHRAFNRQSVWTRIAVVIAGPAFNFIFAVLAFAAIYMIGVDTLKPIFGPPTAGSIAEHGGFQDNDLIIRVGGTETPTLNSALLALVDQATAGDSVELQVKDRNEQTVTRRLDLSQAGDVTAEGRILENLGLAPWVPEGPAVIDQVFDGGAALEAGLRSGDRIVALDGEPIETWSQWAKRVAASPETTLRAVVERDGGEFAMDITPKAVPNKAEGGTKGEVKASMLVPPELLALIAANRVQVRLGPLAAFWQGMVQTWDMSWFTLRMIGRMVIGRVSLENISGPITIARYAGQSAMVGLTTFLKFMALVSISLGVLNLLPVPILDGGHLLYYLIEIVKGSPVSENAQFIGQRIGIGVIVMLMGLALFNDLSLVIASLTTATTG